LSLVEWSSRPCSAFSAISVIIEPLRSAASPSPISLKYRPLRFTRSSCYSILNMSSQTIPTRISSRSCIGCFQRKIKCNRLHPCTNCSKTGEDCTFPQTPVRRKRVRRHSGFNKKLTGGGARYVTKERIDDSGSSTSGSTETKDEILVVDGASRSRFTLWEFLGKYQRNLILIPPKIDSFLPYI
jgi:hypothetical protein